MHSTKTLLMQIQGNSAELCSRIHPAPVSLSMAFTLMGLLILASSRDLSAEETNPNVAESDLILAPSTSLSSSGTFSLPISAEPDDADRKFQDILKLERQGSYLSALEKANAAVEAEPMNVSAYIVRGHIYTEMKLWDKAEDDYRIIVKIDPDNFPAKFNLSELKLMQKDYDNARLGFVALEKHPDWGDLAAYKVFVCDLFGGHEDVAQNELDAFDKVGRHPSYYYSKATWDYYHKRPETAITWLNAAAQIYPHKKVFFYSATLVVFGYIPPTPQEDQAQ
jgi:tetratricopeptide (TPR) repeat protein